MFESGTRLGCGLVRTSEIRDPSWFSRVRRGARAVRRTALALSLGFSGLGCSSTEYSWSKPRSSASATEIKAGKAKRGTPPRWVLLPDRAEPSFRQELPDGTRRLIVHGVRVLDHPDGSLVQAAAPLPMVPAHTLELPPRLGGGFLFYASASHSTWLWRSSDWTSKLQPLAQVDPEVVDVIPGFDRLYLVGKHTHGLRAINAKSGKAVELGSLPLTPSFGGLAFLDPWVGVVASDVRGLLASFDAGTSWHPLGLDVARRLGAHVEPHAISFDTASGRVTLDARGALRAAQPSQAHAREILPQSSWFERETPPPMALPDDDDDDGEEPAAGEVSREQAVFGERPLHEAVLHGIPALSADKEPAAVVLSGRAIGLVRLSDGVLLKVRPKAVGELGRCHGIHLGKGYGFVCSDELTRTVVFSYEGGLSIAPKYEFSGARFVAEAGWGGLVVRGRCPGLPDVEGSEGRYCTIARSGQIKELVVRGDVGAERVSVLPDGRQVVLIPPRLGAKGNLTLIGPEGSEHHELDVSGVDPDLASLLRAGLWLDGLRVDAKGKLGTWVVGAGPFVGVKISLKGKVAVGRAQQSIEHSLLSGARAFLLTAGAVGKESTNFGFEWHEVALPKSLDERPPSEPAGAVVERGCSEIGCAFEEWLRIGYGEGDDKAADPEPPPVVNHYSRGYARWALECVATGKRSRPSPRNLLRTGPTRARSDSAGVYQSTAWLPFFGVSAPQRSLSGTIGFEYVPESGGFPLRAYVWGPRDGGWDKRTDWLVRVADPFQAGRVWSSGTGRSPWRDLGAAAQVFGQDSMTSVDWQVELDASSNQALLLIRARGATEVFLLEPERVPRHLSNTADLSMDRLAGLAATRGVWYFAVALAQSIRVYRVEGTQADLLGEYPQFARDARVVTALVARADGRGLALWSKASTSGWYIFPIDGDSGAVSDPQHIPLDDLKAIPPPCEEDSVGYRVVSPVPLTDTMHSLSNTHIDFDGIEDLDVKGVSARLLIGENQLCVEDMAVSADDPLPSVLPRGKLAATRERPIGLTVTERSSETQADFACTRH